MLLSYIRYELLFGYGLPFGAVVAGQRFTELSYLWHNDFWAAILSKPVNYSWRRRLVLIVAVVTSVLIAATAAPSSAVAIIPRLDL